MTLTIAEFLNDFQWVIIYVIATLFFVSILNIIWRTIIAIWTWLKKNDTI